MQMLNEAKDHSIQSYKDQLSKRVTQDKIISEMPTIRINAAQTTAKT